MTTAEMRSLADEAESWATYSARRSIAEQMRRHAAALREAADKIDFQAGLIMTAGVALTKLLAWHEAGHGPPPDVVKEIHSYPRKAKHQ